MKWRTPDWVRKLLPGMIPAAGATAFLFLGRPTPSILFMLVGLAMIYSWPLAALGSSILYLILALFTAFILAKFALTILFTFLFLSGLLCLYFSVRT